MKLKCYCCGNPVEKERFSLVTLEGLFSDRVFIMRPEHVERISNDAITMLVKEIRKSDRD